MSYIKPTFIVPMPGNSPMACDACVWGRGEHADFCEQQREQQRDHIAALAHFNSMNREERLEWIREIMQRELGPNVKWQYNPGTPPDPNWRDETYPLAPPVQVDDAPSK